jgi:hypothetical protein
LQALRWLAVYAVSYPFAFSCIAIAKLLVLDRMLGYSQRKTAAVPSRWSSLFHFLIASVVVGNVAGLCGNIAAAAFFFEAARSYDLAASANSSATQVPVWLTTAQSQTSQGVKASATLFGFETIMLLLIVVAISLAGFVTSRHILAALRTVKSCQLQDRLTSAMSHRSIEETSALKGSTDRVVQTGEQMRRQVLCTCSVVFVSFLLRAVYTTMFTLVTALQINAGVVDSCPAYTNRCSTCYNVYSHVLVWLLFTPEFHFFVALVCQPVALLVTLWGMTSGHTIDVMKSRGQQRDAV